MRGEEQEVQRRPGGRSARVRAAVLEAALQAIAEGGPGGASISEIARRAGVHASSVQRRWGTADKVLLDALLTLSSETLPVPDTGELRGDLIAFGGLLAAQLATPLGGALVRAMAAAEDDSALADGRERFWRSRYEVASVMLERAVARKEIDGIVDPALGLELFIAPLHFRALLTRQPVDAAVIEQLVDTLLGGLGGRPHNT